MKKIKEPIKVDEADENGLILVPGDDDGFHIQEAEGKGKIYVYYTEAPMLINRITEKVML